MIAPSNHFERFLAETIKHPLPDRTSSPPAIAAHLVEATGRLIFSFLLFLRFVDDESGIVAFVAHQPGACKPIDRISISSGQQPRVGWNLSLDVLPT